MRHLASTALILGLVIAFPVPVLACTVFFAFDGKLALAAQSEDWDDPNTQLWVVPRTPTSHGVLYFGFGRGDYPSNGVKFSPKVQKILRGHVDTLDSVTTEDLYGLPQQGINDKGLFFGGTETEAVKGAHRPGIPKYDGAIVDLVMRRCETVGDALKVLRAYDYVMPAGQLLFGDRSGNSFILEAGHVIIRKVGRHQVITNFLQSRHPAKKITDQRYVLVIRRLQQVSRLSKELAVGLLNRVQQPNTQYSLVFDLTHGAVFVYRDRRFDKGVELIVKKELDKGPHAMSIRSLFSRGRS